jgi:hypothetical protein
LQDIDFTSELKFTYPPVSAIKHAFRLEKSFSSLFPPGILVVLEAVRIGETFSEAGPTGRREQIGSACELKSRSHDGRHVRQRRHDIPLYADVSASFDNMYLFEKAGLIPANRRGALQN